MLKNYGLGEDCHHYQIKGGLYGDFQMHQMREGVQEREAVHGSPLENRNPMGPKDNMQAETRPGQEGA